MIRTLPTNQLFVAPSFWNTAVAGRVLIFRFPDSEEGVVSVRSSARTFHVSWSRVSSVRLLKADEPLSWLLPVIFPYCKKRLLYISLAVTVSKY